MIVAMIIETHEANCKFMYVVKICDEYRGKSSKIRY